ncbi:MAG: cupredoxin domain-containing protein [Acidimicrobiia bacterium]|nr:cupredoxin domain-containing protein [Acidimicrobiia bacterium]
MPTNRLRPSAFVLAVAALVLGACTGTSAPTATSTTDGTDPGIEFTFGAPADPAEADRTVEIVASDDFRFDPATLTVVAGETITFQIVNAGQDPHDFTLGDQVAQDEHEAEVADMGGTMMHDTANAVSVDAGETKELTWRFTQAGTVLIGCHQPGHYAAGMTGQITVQA